MTEKKITFHIFTPFKQGAYGGRVQFLKALRSQLEHRDLYSQDYTRADVAIFDSFPSGHVVELYQKVRQFKRLPGKRTVIHRVDGPISIVRGSTRDVYVDEAIRKFNDEIADGTIYQSYWSKMLCEKCGIGLGRASALIINAPDSNIFFPKGASSPVGRKIRIVATSWSSNWRKGFDIYKYLDEQLDFDLYEFNFIGNTPIQFKNIVHIPALDPIELAKELRNSDIYISASVDDPCSNSVLEAKAVGLKLLLRNSGGHPELLGGRGLLFNGASDVLSVLTKCANLSLESSSVMDIEQVTAKYIEFADSVHNGLHGVKGKTAASKSIYVAALLQRYKPPLTKKFCEVLPVKESNFYKSSKILKVVKGGASSLADLEEWVGSVFDRVPLFLNCMRNSTNPGLFRFSYTSDLRAEPYLVSSIFAAKIGYMVDCLSDSDRKNLAAHILSFQNSDGSIYESWLIRRSYFRRSLVALWTKDFKVLKNDQMKRAETRQSFAALESLGVSSGVGYACLPYDREGVVKYIRYLNWKSPWSAISHFSHLIFFISVNTSMSAELKKGILQFAMDYVFENYRRADGFWYEKGAEVPLTQKIDGAMKMVTALDRTDSGAISDLPMLIDSCLKAVNDGHACNHFNVVFVLNHCMKYCDHRREEVGEYLTRRLASLREHYWSMHGGFSFYENACNDRFYDARISTGMSEPDLHGTKMMLWGIKLISDSLGWELSRSVRAPIT